MARWWVLGLGVLLAACRPGGARTLGRNPTAVTRTISQLKQAPALPLEWGVTGEMIEKCPVAGCWFVLRDDTGTLKVDTKAAGFVVLDVPLHTRVRVAGRLVEDGSQRVLEATGLRY